jgi:hypothetical protein
LGIVISFLKLSIVCGLSTIIAPSPPLIKVGFAIDVALVSLPNKKDKAKEVLEGLGVKVVLGARVSSHKGPQYDEKGDGATFSVGLNNDSSIEGVG